MQFLKKHYEKILLSVVLLGLAVAAAALPLLVAQTREGIEVTITSPSPARQAAWAAIDLEKNRALVSRLDSRIHFDLTDGHNLFNPVRWIKHPDGRYMKISASTDFGVGALQIARITPLTLKVSFEMDAANNGDQYYRVSILRETGDSRSRGPDVRSAPLQQKNQLFRILKVDGAPESPTALHIQLDGSARQLQLGDDFGTIVVPKDEPYETIIGYVADLHYPPENNKTFSNLKVGDKLRLQREPEEYKIVDISANEVVLSGDKSLKKTTIASRSSNP